MRGNKKDSETNQPCPGHLVPFGRQDYNYYKCDTCGKLRILNKKEKQATLV